MLVPVRRSVARGTFLFTAQRTLETGIKVLSRIFPENQPRAGCARHGFREGGTYARHGRVDGAWRDAVVVEWLLGEAAAVVTTRIEL